jgi:hypothetical protein
MFYRKRKLLVFLARDCIWVFYFATMKQNKQKCNFYGTLSAANKIIKKMTDKTFSDQKKSEIVLRNFFSEKDNISTFKLNPIFTYCQ